MGCHQADRSKWPYPPTVEQMLTPYTWIPNAFSQLHLHSGVVHVPSHVHWGFIFLLQGDIQDHTSPSVAVFPWSPLI